MEKYKCIIQMIRFLKGIFNYNINGGARPEETTDCVAIFPNITNQQTMISMYTHHLWNTIIYLMDKYI